MNDYVTQADAASPESPFEAPSGYFQRVVETGSAGRGDADGAAGALGIESSDQATSLSLLGAILESSADAIIAISMDGEVLTCNSKFTSMWGFPPEMVHRRALRELIDFAAQQVKDPDRFRQLTRVPLAHSDEKTFNFIELKDGRVFDRTSLPLQVGDKRIGIVVTLRDMTEHIQVEAALRYREEKYRLLWKAAGDAFILVGRDNIILEANPSVQDVFGYQPEELIGQDIALLQPERLREAHRRGLERYLRTGTTKLNWRATEALGLHRDGHEVPLELAFNHLNLDGVDLFAGFVRDITERKRAESERDELLAREQAARVEAETANRTKDEFLATLSHELRTPLNAIIGWAHLIGDPRLGEDDKAQGMEIIKRSAQLQARLVEDILDVSRIVSGKLSLQLSEIELAASVEDAIESVLPSAVEKGIDLQAIFEDGPTRVQADRDRLQQVVWNLLTNAIKFTPEGGRVTVETQRHGSQVKVRVCDSGIGIPSDIQPYIFERFRQGDQSSTRKHNGLGLGLAIVRFIVEGHSGTIAVESGGEGQGSTFTVTLPLATPLS